MTFAIETITDENSEPTIRFKVITPVYSTLIVKEELPEYMKLDEPITNSQQVYELFGFLKDETKEHFIGVHVDSKNRILAIDRIATGSMNAAIVHPREAYKSALLSSAAGIIFVHNHPSGDSTPSREDIELSRRLSEASELIGIRMLDSIVVGSRGYASLADRGII